MTIEKLIDFLTTGSIFLARLDTFEDNFENIEPFDITQLKLLILNKPENHNPEISDDTWEHITKESREKFKRLQNKLINEQKRRFVSCWILSDVESFGMWDTYGKSGFALRFKREYFQNVIRQSISLQKLPTSKIDLLVVGEVKYQNFDNMHLEERQSLLRFSAFRKHLSFKHESEYRIVGFTNQIEEEKGLRFKLSNLDTLDFEIISNPRLSHFQFQQFQNIIGHYTKKHNLKESELKVGWNLEIHFINTQTMIKKHFKIIIILIAMVLVAGFWFAANAQNVYENAAMGALSEMLWLPMIALTVGTPVLAIIFWAQQKLSWKSPFPYLAVLSLWPLLYL